MKASVIVFSMLVFILTSGCGQRYYRNVSAGRNFDQDRSYCNAVAAGSVPMPAMQQYQNNTYAYAPNSGVMKDQYGNIYRYQEDYNAMAAAQGNMAMAQQNFNNASVSMQNAAAQFGAQGAKNSIVNQCMAQLGWVEIPKQEYDMMNNRYSGASNGDDIPRDFKAVELETITFGEIKKFVAMNKGKVVVISFFAAGSSPCQEQIFGLIRIRKDISEDKLVLIGAIVDTDSIDLGRYMANTPFNYPVKKVEQDLMGAAGVSAVPHMLVFSGEGKIVANSPGFVPEPALRDFLQQQMGKK